MADTFLKRSITRKKTTKARKPAKSSKSAKKAAKPARKKYKSKIKAPLKKEVKRKRISTGIPGLDKLMEGGYLENDIYLVTGGTGTGKTLFCSQFLWDGLKKGEKSIYYSLEEMPQDVLHDAKIFGWDFQKYIDKKQFEITYQDPFEVADITSEVKERIKKFGARRVVIDSTSIFGMIFENKHELRKRLYELIKVLKETDAVVLMTAEILENSKGLSRFGVEEFVADGVILLNYLGIGGTSTRSLVIRKMRRTKHAQESFILDIGKGGLAVKKEQTL